VITERNPESAEIWTSYLAARRTEFHVNTGAVWTFALSAGPVKRGAGRARAASASVLDRLAASTVMGTLRASAIRTITLLSTQVSLSLLALFAMGQLDDHSFTWMNAALTL